MTVGRREMMLGTLGMGVALAAGPRPAKAVDVDIPQPFSTYGIVPGGGIDQTASLQDAADQAARSGTPFFLPPGNYTTYKLELKSGTQIQGVPGKSVLRYTGGGRLISIENAAGIRLTGLTLAGEARQRQPHRRLRLLGDPLEFRLELPNGRKFLRAAGRGRALRRVLLRGRGDCQQKGAMTSAKFALLSTAAIFALGLTTLPAGAALTTGQVLNTPVDVGAPPKEMQDAAKKAAAAAPTMGEALHTPIDKGEPPKQMQEASKKAAAAAPTTGEALHTGSTKDRRRNEPTDA
jgi:hypothetical protein